MSEPRIDHLEARMAAGEPLLERFEDDSLQPPAALDRRVLADARNALATGAARPAAVKPRRPLRWAVPVALAATLVLSFTLVLQTEQTAPMSQERTVQVEALDQDSFAENAAVTPEDSAAANEAAPLPAPAPAPVQAIDKPTRRSPAAADVAAPTFARSRETVTGIAGVADKPAPTAPAAIGAATASAASKAAESAEADFRRTAASWLDEVARLRASGDNAAADREFALLAQRFPDDAAVAPAAAPR